MRKFRPRRHPSSPPSENEHPQNGLTVSQIIKVLVGSGVMLFVCNLCYDAAQAPLLRRMQLEAENKQLRTQLEHIDRKVLPRLEAAHDEVKNIQQPLQHDKLTSTQQQQLALKARGVCESLEEIEHLLKLNTVARLDKKNKAQELELADIFIVLPSTASAAPPANQSSRSKTKLESARRESESPLRRNSPESLAEESMRQNPLPTNVAEKMPGAGAALMPPNLARLEKNLFFLGLPDLPKSRKATDIQRIIFEHKATIQDCYTRILKDQPGLSGEIKVRLTIAPSGKVIGAVLLASTVNHATLEQLICERMLRWNDFGEVRPEAGNVTFKQNFILGQK